MSSGASSAVSSSPSPSASSAWSAASLAGLTLDSFSFDSFDPSGAPPHPEANPSGLRSDAEINALALPEQLSELDRLHALLLSTHAVQRRSAATQLVSVLDGEWRRTGDSKSAEAGSAASIRQLLSGVLRLLCELEEEEQAAVSEALVECADRGFVSQQACMDELLPELLHFLTPSDWTQTAASSSSASSSPSNASSSASPSSSSSGFASSASATAAAARGPQLAPCLHLLTRLLSAHSSHPPLLSALSSFALKSADSIHSSSRLVSAELLAVLSPHLSAAAASSLLPSFLPLCQDTSMDVRVAMSAAVCRLADTLRSTPASLQSIVSELSELLRDEELAVKQCALLSSVAVLPLLPPPLLSASLLPVFRSYLSAPPHLLHATVARVLGEWCVCCGSSLSSDARVLREFYRSSSVGGDNDVRYWCAFNLPALVSLLPPDSATAAPSSVASSSALFDVSFLSPLLTSFSHDTHPPVRLSLSHSLPALAPLLLRASPSHVKLLKDVAVALLKDSETVVRANTLACIPALLAAHSNSAPSPLAGSSPAPKLASVASSVYTSASAAAAGGVDASVLTELFRAMLAVDFGSLSYRHRMLYLDSLYSLRHHFTTHDMQYLYYDRLTPLLFASLHASPPLPLLQLLLAFLCHFLSSLPSSQRRHDLLLRLLRLYSPTARSCYDRLVFVRLVDEMGAVFSRRWMRKHTLPHSVKLMQTEAVREVKLRMLAVLGGRTALRCMDAKEREQFGKWVHALTAEGDAHTVELANHFLARRPFERGEKSGSSAEERAVEEEEERLDRAREEREDRLLREEEELLEAMMRKEQVRERNVLLSSSSGSQANNAVMLLMMKQKKEREKELKQTQGKDSTSSSTTALAQQQLAPVTPQHGKAVASAAGKGHAGTVSRTGRVRGGSDKGLGNLASALEEKEREEEERQKGRPRGYFPGLASASSTPTAASLSSASSSSALFSAAALRSASPSSSSPPSSVVKRSTPLLPSAGLHPMSRRYPSASTSAVSLPSPTAPSAAASPLTPSPLHAPSSSSLSSLIPQLTHGSSPRTGKPSHNSAGGGSAAAAAGKPPKFGAHASGATVAAVGGSSGRRV